MTNKYNKRFCSVFNVVCRKRLSSPRCRSELIDFAWVVIVPGQKCIKKKNKKNKYTFLGVNCQFGGLNSVFRI